MSRNCTIFRWLPMGLMLLLPLSQARAELVVSAAISLKGVLEKVQPELEKATGERISFNFGASGILAGQIQQGAPVDLFISADRANVERLVSAKEVAAESVKVIAGNALVLIQANGTTLNGFADLASVKRLAIGEPKVVPAGMYAKQVLVSLKLWDSLQKKLVTCENVAQVVTLVDRGEVDAGLVYRTDAAAAKNVRLVAEADPALHGKIEYVSAVVAASHNKKGAEKTQRALGSEKVVAAFKELGFAAPRP